jgi:hypothetical protein
VLVHARYGGAFEDRCGIARALTGKAANPGARTSVLVRRELVDQPGAVEFPCPRSRLQYFFSRRIHNSTIADGRIAASTSAIRVMNNSSLASSAVGGHTSVPGRSQPFLPAWQVAKLDNQPRSLETNRSKTDEAQSTNHRSAIALSRPPVGGVSPRAILPRFPASVSYPDIRPPRIGSPVGGRSDMAAVELA